jgi:putative sigma-54 modulation protein
MRIAFTFRNLEPSDSIKKHATEKIGKLQKYLHGPLDAELTFSLERHLHCVDVSIASSGETYLGRAELEDMYASIDVVVDKIRQQLRRTKTEHSHARRATSAELLGAGE